MISWINEIAADWVNLFIIFSIQNSVFLLAVLSLAFLLRKKQAILIRTILLIGLFKLFVPPFLSIEQPVSFLQISAKLEMPVVSLGNTMPLIQQTLSVQSIWFLLWLSIVLILSLFVVVNQLRLRRVINEAKTIEIEDSLISRKLKDRINFFISKYNHSPFITGLFTIKLVLPSSWDTLSIDKKKIIINHELAHLKLKDNWIGLIGILAMVVHFFNPLVWLLIKFIRESSEKVCDDFAANDVNKTALVYVKNLLSISKNLSTNLPGLVNSTPFSRSHSKMKGRINYQLNRKENTHMKWYSKKVIIIALGMFVLFLACSIENPQEIDTSNQFSKLVASAEFEEFFDLDVKPKLIKKEVPKYPEVARRAGVDGRVTVMVLIDESGKVVSADTLKSPHPSLGAAALEAALKCEFSPAEKDGKNVKCKMTIPYEFRLKSGSGIESKTFKNEEDAISYYEGDLKGSINVKDKSGKKTKTITNIISSGEQSALLQMPNGNYQYLSRDVLKVVIINSNSVEGIKEKLK